MYNRMLNATKAGINKKGKYTWHTPNYTAFLDKENEGEAYLLDVPKQVYAQAFVDLQRAHQNHANNPGHYGTPKYASKNRRESFRLCATRRGKYTPKETSAGSIPRIFVFRRLGQSMWFVIVIRRLGLSSRTLLFR